MKTTPHLLSVCCLLLVFELTAQSDFHNVTSFGKTEGIFYTPTTVAEDNDGFLWLGTGRGLYRFDGVQAIEVDVFSDAGFPEKHIRRLAFDPDSSRLWICTNMGVLRYSLSTGRSEVVQLDSFFPPALKVGGQSEVAYRDRQGDWWVHAQLPGLIRFPADGSPPQHFESLTPTSNAFRSSTVIMVVQDLFQDSIIWGGTRLGLMHINKSSGATRHILFRESGNVSEDYADAMRFIYPHPNGKLYIGTWNGGLLEFDRQTESFRQYLLEPFDAYRLTNQVVTIFPRTENELWVTGAAHLYAFDMKKKEMRLVKKNAGIDFIDRQGRFWNLTREGLDIYHPDQNQFKRHYFPEENDFRVEQTLNFLETDGGRKILLGGKCRGGVLEYDRFLDRWTILPFSGKENKIVRGNILVQTPAGIVANDEHSLFVMRPGSRRFEELPLSIPGSAGELTGCTTADGSVFIVGAHGYFFWLRPGSTEMTTFAPGEVNEPYPGYFTELILSPADRFGRPWLRTAGGFSIFLPDENRFDHYPYREHTDRFFFNIRHFWPDDRGRVWCNSTNGIGWIDPLRPEEGLQQRFEASNGFVFSGIWYPKTDRDGRVWFISDRGLFCLDPETSLVLASGSYALQIHFLSSGELVVAAVKGFGILHPNNLKAATELPRPYLTWMKVFEEKRPLAGSVFHPEPIRLKPDENFISLGFSAQQYLQPHLVRFAYQLEGVDKEWVYPDPNNRSVSYSNLKGGDYTFRLKAVDFGGNETRSTFTLAIHIGTPWYLTTPAFGIYGLTFALLIWGMLRFQRRRLEWAAHLEAEKAEALRLKELDRFKSRFFTNITHEFRTPLTVILGLVQSLKNGKTAEPAQTIERNSRNLLDLVNQMLDLARLEAGRLKLDLIQADVMLFMRAQIESFHSLAEGKKQRLSFQARPGSFEMDFDTRHLRQVLANLVGNAIKFTPEYGDIDILALIREGEECDMLELTVSDTGIGIPEDQLPRIFDRFFQLDSETSSSGHGSGIGLALTQELVRLMGGTIAVKSTPGEGSIFTVSLPVRRQAPVAAWEHPAPVPPKNGSVPSGGGVRDFFDDMPLLLLVEDHPDLARYLSQLLKGKYNLMLASNGREAFEKALEIPPDIVLSDVMMPEMDGMELCRHLKNDIRTSHIPVILLTAKAAVEDKLAGLETGADAYLSKPFDQDELLAHLDNVLRVRQLLRAHFLQNTNLEPGLEPVARPQNAFLAQLRELIDRNLEDESFDMTRLSREMAMSRMQLHRKLTALTGQSASVFVRAHRLARARELLVSSNLTVSEVAYKVGFSDNSYFIKCFKEAYGTTPGAFKQ
jgi:signal transduction histidine kinase/CheY-like chemotaxis protein/AraC-like DNA-binding protein/ligand-binding sensor domain-containing protein